MKRTCAAAHESLERRVDPGPAFTTLIELRDFLRVNLPRLTDKQRRILLAWSEGKTCKDLAAEEGVSAEAIHDRLNGGLRKLRLLAGTSAG